MNCLGSLKKITVVVADSGDINAIKTLNPIDATTNPSLILAASKSAQYQHLIADAIASAGPNMADICDQLIVNFGCEILKVIPGRISSEVDASLSFDTRGSIDKGRKLIALYRAAGISKERVLIKLAATWQGIKAAEQLEKEGIHCNLTLMFSMAQAKACAEANITLISPFVGRILDWYKANTSNAAEDQFSGANDPGVKSVSQIYHYFKANNYHTQIMGASFRNSQQIIELAGCDLLTISPALLTELAEIPGELKVKLSADNLKIKPEANIVPLTAETFAWQHNEDAMAVEKLAEGIRKFAVDQKALEAQVLAHVQQPTVA